MMNYFTVGCFIAAGLITAVNVVVMIVNNKQRKALIAKYEAFEERQKLTDYQKNVICASYCRYRQDYKKDKITIDRLETRCNQCPLYEL